MDGWLKALITAACIVVIAAGAWYLFSEIQEKRAAAQRAETREAVRKELFSLANATDGDNETVRAFCRRIRDQIGKGITDNDYSRQVVTNCRALGMM